MKRARAKSPAGPLSRQEIEETALRYLDRFDSSNDNLRRVLARHVDRAVREGRADANEARELVESVLERYRASGVVDDARFAGALAGGLRRRGASRVAIVQKLRARGVTDEIARAALVRVDEHDGEAEVEPELAAARALVRRRRIGPYRPEADRAAHARRDLGALARAGFSIDIARRALGVGDGDAAESPTGGDDF